MGENETERMVEVEDMWAAGRVDRKREERNEGDRER